MLKVELNKVKYSEPENHNNLMGKDKKINNLSN